MTDYDKIDFFTDPGVANDNPDIQARLRTGPGRIPDFIEEVAPIAIRSISRTRIASISTGPGCAITFPSAGDRMPAWARRYEYEPTCLLSGLQALHVEWDKA
jgi:hypothetical protein